MLLALAFLAASAAAPLTDRVVLPNTGGTICVTGASTGWTAAHVADHMKRDGNFGWTSRLRKGTVRVGEQDNKRDVARVFADEGDRFPESVAAVPGELRSGDAIVVVGDASHVLARREPAVVHGWFVGKDSSGFLILDVALYFGFSGGCVLDSAGNLRGIAAAVVADEQGRFRPYAVATEVVP